MSKLEATDKKSYGADDYYYDHSHCNSKNDFANSGSSKQFESGL